jgi:hypothetical protein
LARIGLPEWTGITGLLAWKVKEGSFGFSSDGMMRMIGGFDHTSCLRIIRGPVSADTLKGERLIGQATGPHLCGDLPELLPNVGGRVWNSTE